MLGTAKRKHPDWFDESHLEIEKILGEKRAAFQDLLSDQKSSVKRARYANARDDFQRKVRVMKDSWWSTKVAEMQSMHACNNSKDLYDAVKRVYGPSSRNVAPLRSTDGNQLLKE